MHTLGRLMLVTSRHVGGPDWITRVVAAAEAGVNIVQLREKDLPPSEQRHLLQTLDARLPPHVTLLLNGPQELVTDCSSRVGWHAKYQSIHSVDEAHAAAHAPYLILGTLYPTPSKPGHPGAGVELLRECAAAVTTPLYAIGGITLQHIPELLQAGAYGIAVIRAILAAPDPAAEARQFHSCLRLNS